MKIKEVINEMLLSVSIKHSKGTHKFYRSHLEHFLNWCNKQDIKEANEFTKDMLVYYIQDLKETCSNTTINKRIGILKRTFKHSNIDFDYLYQIQKLKETKKTFDMISDKDIKRILDYTKSLIAQDKLMYQALILLLLDTGARINEVMNIEKKNINLIEDEILLTTTKSSEDRKVFFIEDTKEVIKQILKLENKTPYLLYNIRKERQINYDDVRYFFKHIKNELEIDKLHAHMFRHTHATILIENDADLISVMKLLGHRNIKTTERYLHLSNSFIKKTYKDKYKR